MIMDNFGAHYMTTHWPIIDGAVRSERPNVLASQLQLHEAQCRQSRQAANKHVFSVKN